MLLRSGTLIDMAANKADQGSSGVSEGTQGMSVGNAESQNALDRIFALLTDMREENNIRFERLETELKLCNQKLDGQIAEVRRELGTETNNIRVEVAKSVEEVSKVCEIKVTDLETRVDAKMTDISARLDNECEFSKETQGRVSVLEQQVSAICQGNVTSVTPLHVQAAFPMHGVDIPLPRFGRTRGINPKAYLKNLDAYLRAKGVAECNSLLVVRQTLDQEETAWFDVTFDESSDYKDFCTKFLATYWNLTAQANAKMNMYRGQYAPQSRQSMTTYAAHYAVLAGYLDDKMTDEEWCSAMRTHFPTHIQRALVGVVTKDQFLNILRPLDDIEEQEKWRTAQMNAVIENRASQGVVQRNEKPNWHNNGRKREERRERNGKHGQNREEQGRNEAPNHGRRVNCVQATNNEKSQDNNRGPPPATIEAEVREVAQVNTEIQ